MGADASAMNNENVSDRGWGYRRRATWFEALANSAKPQGGGGERDGIVTRDQERKVPLSATIIPRDSAVPPPPPSKAERQVC